MTDPRQPQDPSNGTETTDAEQRAWFRHQVDPIVDAEPVADGWDAIVQRAGDRANPLSEPTGAPRQRSRRLIAAAAAVVAVLAGAAVVVTTRGGHGESVVAGRPDPTPGWYIPRNLPAGWSLRSVELVPGASDPECSTVTRTWEPWTPDGKPATQHLDLTFDTCASLSDIDTAGTRGPALGDGVDASLTFTKPGEGGVAVVAWDHHGLWRLEGTGVSPDQVIEAAKVIVAEPIVDRGPLPNWWLTASGRSGNDDAHASVQVTLNATDDQVVSYRLIVPGGSSAPDPFTTATPTTIDGQANPIVIRDPNAVATPRPADKGGPLAMAGAGRSYVGTWAGADVVVPASVFIDVHNGSPDIEDLRIHQQLIETMISSLRPASADEWTTFLATAQNPITDPRLTSTTSIIDLLAPAAGSTSANIPTTTN